MEIHIAKYSGFCFGVDNAIKTAIKEKDKTDSKIYTFGEIIHNDQVINMLNSKGILLCEDMDILSPKEKLIIRSHGVSRAVYEKANVKELEIIDATCPFVKKLHNLVSENCSKFDTIVIFGDSTHPEIIGAVGWCDKTPIVISTIEQAKKLSDKKIFLLSQTTANEKLFFEILEILKLNNEVIYKNTICKATHQRQESVEKLAREMDAMIIVGGKKSSNTKKLFEISKSICNKTILVETKDEINVKDYLICGKIGIAGGASTPSWIIDEIIDKLRNEGEVLNMDKMDSMQDMMEQIDASFNMPRKGQVVKGKIVMVTDKGIILNIGYKSDGLIPLEEITLRAGENSLSDKYKVNDDLEAMVMKRDDNEGHVLMSLKRITQKKDWEDLQDSFDNDKTMNVLVDSVVKGGLNVYYNNIRGFIPASQVDSQFHKDLSKFNGMTLEVKLLEFNKKKNKVVFTRKALAQAENDKRMNIAWGDLEVGKLITGTVKRFTDFGVFVDVNGVDGLLHITEVSWGKIGNLKETFKADQPIEVKIIDMNREQNKLSLSIKQITPNPWEVIEEKYIIGNPYSGKVVSLTDFGAFVELEPGVEGLVHVSQISNERVEKPSDKLKLSDAVTVRILEIDKTAKRIKLSMKE
jgi:4-hydroxy-3-methylbut-2-enyl diphosphate reductase